MTGRVLVGTFWNVYASRFGYRVPSNVDRMLSKRTPEARDEAITWVTANMDPHKIEVHEIRVYDTNGQRTAESRLTVVFEVAAPTVQSTAEVAAPQPRRRGRAVEQLELPAFGESAA